MIHTSLTAQQVVDATGGALVAGDAAARVTGGILTDSRQAAPGTCFFALSGERFDGNAFAPEASQRGVSVAVVSRVEEGFSSSCAVVLVDDVLEALQKLASWWRSQVEPLRVVGLTGSSGKTSTKDLLLGVLGQAFRVTGTKGNLNNHIGVPLSILRAEKEDEAAVWEMGMNHAGELAPLCAMVRPQIGVITSIGSAHLEFLKSREAIAEEKCTVARCLPEDGFMIYPADCDFVEMIEASTRAKLVPVGGSRGLVRAEGLTSDRDGCRFRLVIEGSGSCDVALPLHGRHMVSNALLAAAAGWCCGMDAESIARGLGEARLTKGRLRCLDADGVTVVDDTYNANPESMKAALETVAQFPCSGRRVAVLGRMGELGDAAGQEHAGIGAFVRACGYDLLIVTGCDADTAAMAEAAQGSSVRVEQASTAEDAASLLAAAVQPGDLVLFKGSRSSGMERVMHQVFPSSK